MHFVTLLIHSQREHLNPACNMESDNICLLDLSRRRAAEVSYPVWAGSRAWETSWGTADGTADGLESHPAATQPRSAAYEPDGHTVMSQQQQQKESGDADDHSPSAWSPQRCAEALYAGRLWESSSLLNTPAGWPWSALKTTTHINNNNNKY